ncbi:DUF4136 domain-containing protein [Belliella kenyensis]|uniref:DUF4136 domain-containing protein n=1 Tax=Belliella kenyensis TaxID=1472724 RepID=A0ABV8ENK9_9BACT|nr:DUF4136 domain-containing protein [Belliella kenyensis]MCH7402053.1 DUF4136 domain-containing protein [Belliella kenyensis]MDN3605217.1 DUF4136 domain-containing protein [Belliella kenyensis]
MNIKKFILFISLSGLFFSCSSIELFKERVEQKPYKENKTFVIVNKEVAIHGFEDVLMNEKIINQIERNMQNLGLTYDKERPDVVIRFSSNEDPRQKDVYQNQFPMWGMRVWDPWMFDPRFMNRGNMVSTKDYELIQLIIDFIDPKQDKMLMTITAVSEASSQKSKQKKLIKSVDKIIDAYDQHMKNS